MVEFSCSDPDSQGYHSLPDVSIKDAHSLITSRESPTLYFAPFFSTLHIFPVNPSLECNGTASALEFCYKEDDESHFFEERNLFTLLLLQQDSSSFTVTNVIEVRTTPRQEICLNYEFNARTVWYCCDSFQLDAADMFDLPSPNFAYAFTYSPSTRSILEYCPTAPHYKYSYTGVPTVGRVLTTNSDQWKNSSEVGGFLMFNFVIGKPVCNFFCFLAIRVLMMTVLS